MKTVDDFKVRLLLATRTELRDDTHGDVIVHWLFEGIEVAIGYFNGKCAGIRFASGDSFKNEDARTLRYYGFLGQVKTPNDKW